MESTALRPADGPAAVNGSGKAPESAPSKKTRSRSKKSRSRPRSSGPAPSVDGLPPAQEPVADAVPAPVATLESAEQRYTAPVRKKARRKAEKAEKAAAMAAAAAAATAGKVNGGGGRKRQEDDEEERPPPRPPSAESGGVPEPTAAYLAQAALPLAPAPAQMLAGSRSRQPQPLLVVIDLNGTLLHRPQRRSAPRTFVARPHAARFLAYCVETFWVVIWSSARPANVEAMCRQLLPSPHQRQRLVAVWGRDHFGLSPDDYNSRVQCYKRLSSLWTDPAVMRSHPSGGGAGGAAAAAAAVWSQANTILIDDSHEKARSEPYNLVAIPEFSGNLAEAPDVLPQVHDYINNLCFQPDVSAYMRVHPFQPTTGQ